MKDQQAIVEGQLGKRKGRMASVEEFGMPHTIRDWLEVDNLHQFLRDTQTHQAVVMTTPNISNVLLEERGVSSSSERNHVCNSGVFEVTETVDTTGLAMGFENHEHVDVEDDYRDNEQPTLEDDVSSFKATLASCEHEEVVKRVLDSLICIAYCAMEDLAFDVQKYTHFDVFPAVIAWKLMFGQIRARDDDGEEEDSSPGDELDHQDSQEY
ncbi:unnamed protein product [Sphagnum balticum]